VLDLEVRPDAPGAQAGGDGSDPASPGPYVERVAATFGIRPASPGAGADRPADPWLRETAAGPGGRGILPRLESDMRLRLRQAAEAEAVPASSRPTCATSCWPRTAGARPTLGLGPRHCARA